MMLWLIYGEKRKDMMNKKIVKCKNFEMCGGFHTGRGKTGLCREKELKMMKKIKKGGK